MPKRFTDTDIWGKEYYQDAPARIKLFWKFLNDNCDLAGVWDGNFKLASFQIGEDISEKDIEKHPEIFSGRIERLGDKGKYLLPTFIEFQYGRLSPSSAPHMAVIRLLEKHGILERFKEYIKSYETIFDPLSNRVRSTKDKDKDKDKGKDKDKDGKLKFGEFVFLSKDEADKLVKRLGSKERARACVDILDNYLGEPGNENKYKSHYRAILRWVEPELIKREKRGAVRYGSNGSVPDASKYDAFIQCGNCSTRHNEKLCPSCGAERPKEAVHG